MLLSIIIPVFNEISYLKRFSNRLFESFEKYEVEYIFINDGSDDGSNEWLSNITTSNKEKNIKYISYRKNKGKGHALREGLKKSTGNFILFQDSDLELDTNDSKEMFEIIYIRTRQLARRQEKWFKKEPVNLFIMMDSLKVEKIYKILDCFMNRIL